jgi:hypothetical protein
VERRPERNTDSHRTQSCPEELRRVDFFEVWIGSRAFLSVNRQDTRMVYACGSATIGYVFGGPTVLTSRYVPTQPDLS